MGNRLLTFQGPRRPRTQGLFTSSGIRRGSLAFLCPRGGLLGSYIHFGRSKGEALSIPREDFLAGKDLMAHAFYPTTVHIRIARKRGARNISLVDGQKPSRPPDDLVLHHL